MSNTPLLPVPHYAVRKARAGDHDAVDAFLAEAHHCGRCLHHFTAECEERFPGHAAALDAMLAGHGFLAYERDHLAGAVWLDLRRPDDPAIGIAIGEADNPAVLRRDLIVAARDQAVRDGIDHFSLLFPSGHPELIEALTGAGIHVESLISYEGTSLVVLSVI